MRKFLSRRPSPAMIIAVVALVAALSGTAVAAKKLSLGALSPGAKKKTVGVGKLTYVSIQQSYNTSPNPTDGYTLTAACPAGTHALGGGVKLVSPSISNSGNFFVFEQYLSTTGFTAQFFAGSNTQADTVQVVASCGISQAVTGAPPVA
jgi:hypothetical protein